MIRFLSNKTLNMLKLEVKLEIEGKVDMISLTGNTMTCAVTLQLKLLISLDLKIVKFSCQQNI